MSEVAKAKSELQDVKLSLMSLMWDPIDDIDAMTEWLDLAQEFDFQGVGTRAQYLLPLLNQMDFAAALEKRDLQLVSVNFSVSKDFAFLREICTQMRDLGAKHLTCIGGLAQRGANMAEVAAILDQIGEIASSYGIIAAFHNHTDHTGETLEETEELVSLTDRRIFSQFLDVGHATKDFFGHPVERRAAIFLERHFEDISLIEFKDWHPETNLNTPVGAGMCDYDAVFQILKKRQYAGWTAVEQNGPAPGMSARECLAQSRHFIRDGLGI